MIFPSCRRSIILPDARDYENYNQSGKKMSLSNDQKNVNRKQIGEKIHETAYQFPTSRYLSCFSTFDSNLRRNAC